MEKAIFPLKYMNVVKNENSKQRHLGGYGLDFASKNKKEDIYAPFDGIIRKVYKIRGNFVWLESRNKVLWADGTYDYMTVLTGHDDNIESLYVGKEVSFGESYYTQGSSGTDYIHVHIEVGRGKFDSNGWHENNNGVWVIDNEEHLFNAFFVNPFIEIKNNGGYIWRSSIDAPVSRDDSKKQIEVSIDTLRCRKKPNGAILGYINKGIYNVLEIKKHGDHSWVKIGESNYIAYSDKYSEFLKQNEKKEKELKKIFSCIKDDTYYLKMVKGEELYIKENENK